LNLALPSLVFLVPLQCSHEWVTGCFRIDVSLRGMLDRHARRGCWRQRRFRQLFLELFGERHHAPLTALSGVLDCPAAVRTRTGWHVATSQLGKLHGRRTTPFTCRGRCKNVISRQTEMRPRSGATGILEVLSDKYPIPRRP
jgi:hypothetical protein